MRFLESKEFTDQCIKEVKELIDQMIIDDIIEKSKENKEEDKNVG